MARKNLDAGQGQNLTTFTTGFFAPGANRLVLAFIMNRQVGAGIPGQPLSVTGNNLTWVLVNSFAVGTDGPRLSCFRSMGPTPAATPLTITFQQQQARCAWSIFEYDNVATGGINGAEAVLQAKVQPGTNTQFFELALNNPLGFATNIVVGGIALSANRLVNPDMGELEIAEQSAANGTLQTQDRVGGGQSVKWSWTGAADAAVMAIEIKAAEIPPLEKAFNVEALVRRFEPVLFFHPQETFFPSDAKRYVEHSALWRARIPFDQKALWGGDNTAPFPRKPMIAKGSIAATDGEPGTFLGFMPAENQEEESFFELGGWKDAAGADQPDVTDTSQNTYANRGRIKELYDTDIDLRYSRFWYHAEFFSNTQLEKLLGGISTPDLLKVLNKRKAGNNAKDVALLCYYFFFPAHEESLPAICDNVEAKEFVCFGGEWACLALLLERDGPDATYYPTFIGHSGRLVLDPATNQPVPGQAWDIYETGQTMRVSPATASELDGAPNVFVAKGTHSFYRNTDPVKNGYITPSRDCGREEALTLITDSGLGKFGEGLLVEWWKITGGGLLHLVSGGLSLPVGAIAGTAWAIAEHFSFEAPAQKAEDAAADDELAPAGTGMVVHPSTIEAPPEWTDHEPWRSEQGMKLTGRRYDFLVDRVRQRWWPGDTDNFGGYGGRWGPQVEHDPNGRRSGMRFPSYWYMFFLALEDGGF